MKPLGIAVIGVGNMGSRYANILADSPWAGLVAVADSDERRMSEISAQWGVHGYTDYRAMLEGEKDIEAVAICTPDGLHTEPALLAASMGKHIMVEKPLATTVSDGERMIRAAADAHVKLMVGHALRFDPRHIQAQQAIRSGVIGEPMHVFCRRNDTAASGQVWRKRSTPVFFLGIHDVDIMRWMMNSEVVRVCAEGKSIEPGGPVGQDSVGAVLRFASGSFGILEVSWLLPPSMGRSDLRLEVLGTKGAVFVQMYDRGLEVHSPEGLVRPDTILMPSVREHITGILRDEVYHFLECVLQDRQPAVSGEDGLAALKIALALTESLHTGMPVEL
jgi:predicted dehydrogenase